MNARLLEREHRDVENLFEDHRSAPSESKRAILENITAELTKHMLADNVLPRRRSCVVCEVSPSYFFLRAPRFLGTLPPSRLASESPIAIACFRLVTFFPERPDFSVPCFRSCIAFSTFDFAFLPYRAMASSWKQLKY